MKAAWILTVALFTAAGCGDKIDQAKQALAVAKEAAKQAKGMGEAAQGVAARAGEAGEGTDGSASPEQAMAQMGAVMGELEASGQLSGPVVSWRDLVAFVPDHIGEWKATNEVEGKTTKMGGMEVTVVKRSYAAGDKNLRVTISDTVFAAMMRMPFNMAAMIQEDSSDGYKKGTKIEDHVAIVEWNKKNARSTASALVGGRFLVDIRVTAGAEAGDAEAVANQLELAKLAAVKPEGA